MQFEWLIIYTSEHFSCSLCAYCTLVTNLQRSSIFWGVIRSVRNMAKDSMWQTAAQTLHFKISSTVGIGSDCYRLQIMPPNSVLMLFMWWSVCSDMLLLSIFLKTRQMNVRSWTSNVRNLLRVVEGHPAHRLDSYSPLVLSVFGSPSPSLPPFHSLLCRLLYLVSFASLVFSVTFLIP